MSTHSVMIPIFINVLTVVFTKPMRQHVTPAGEPLAYPVEIAAEMIGIGRTWMWKLVREKTVPTVRIGKRVLVTRDALSDYLRGLSEDEAV